MNEHQEPVVVSAPLTEASMKVMLLENNKSLVDDVDKRVMAQITPFSQQAVELAKNDGRQEAKIDQLKVRIWAVGFSVGAAGAGIGGFIGFIAANVINKG